MAQLLLVICGIFTVANSKIGPVSVRDHQFLLPSVCNDLFSILR